MYLFEGECMYLFEGECMYLLEGQVYVSVRGSSVCIWLSMECMYRLRMVYPMLVSKALFN